MPYKYNPFIGNLDNNATAISIGAITEIATDSGPANPSSGIININGDLGIVTSGAGDIVTVKLDPPVVEIYGGTGTTTYTTGDILYASAANTLSKLAIGADGEVLTLAGGVPTWAVPTGGTVTSVSGTANRITSTGGNTPVIDIAATYVGQTSITTLGTITVGTWHGNSITVPYGGTGASTLTGVLTGNGASAITANTVTQYGVLVGGASNAVGSIAVGSAGQVLQSSGAGVNPAYSTATYPSVAGTSGKILQSNGTNFVESTPTYPSSSGTAGKILRSDGTNNLYSTATFPDLAGSNGNVLTSDGTNWSSSAPTGGASTLYINYLWTNLGINYNAGTGVFTVKGATADLSVSNIAYITFPSDTTPGISVTVGVTANQSFIDDVGASEIIGNLFGWTTGVAIAVDVPFFIYAVIDDAETAVKFMLSREPGRRYSPASANIGFPGTANADVQEGFFSFDSITAADYETNPCVMVGSIRMRMSASDDWTVQALNNKFDGIGNFQEENMFTMPLGQLGANASTYTLANGGTAPVFSTSAAEYSITKNGYCTYRMYLNGDGGTDGSGAVTGLCSAPFKFNANNSLKSVGSCSITAAGSATERVGNTQNNGSNASILFYVQSFDLVLWSDFATGSRYIVSEINWLILD